MDVLIIIDTQKDFIDGILGTPEAVVAAQNIVSRIENSKGELILFTQDTHQDDYLDTAEGKKLPVVHCIENTDGWQIDPGVLSAWKNNPDTVLLSDHAHIFQKPVFGCLELAHYLCQRVDEISKIELVGICTDICVISNALLLKNFMPDTPVFVNSSCCAATTPRNHEKALDIMTACHIDIV